MKLALIAVCAVVSLSAQDPTEYGDARARDLLTSGRIAISGGPNGIARLRAMTLKGHSRIPTAEGELVAAAVEIKILLPDRYIRIDTGSFGRRVSGYAGSTSLNLIESKNQRIAPDAHDGGVLEANRWEFARFMLGIATYASQEVQLKIETRGTRREMPGSGDPMGFAASSERGFAARLILDAQSHLPARVIYWDTTHKVFTMTFSEHKPTGGLRLPYHIVTTAGDRTMDELSFDEIVVNPSLSKADFSS